MKRHKTEEQSQSRGDYGQMTTKENGRSYMDPGTGRAFVEKLVKFE